eukprot:TRINITY_DN10689_c0_g1_i1.p1 TRINITY_DN10689_c0_g1~~TRINITY_DN10689_c0_g1_i1.p1  ORF type:complete len:480 (-),score=82.32 TRINITY_DN10689_c0_g1_i1:159-1598(-)
MEQDSERVVKTVVPPIATVLEDLWDANDEPIIENLKKHFVREGRLTHDDVRKILSKATAILREEPNILTLPEPITICGDVHGQYYDVLKLFEIGGDPATTMYLFLGDYVDRGYFSIEVLLYMYCLKIKYKDTFFMLRGNHECRHLTDYFTFKEECKHKYSLEIYDLANVSFDALPLAAVVNKQFFCVHGGLSPDALTLDVISGIDRFREPPQSGVLCDLLWADPKEKFDYSDSAEFIPNETRGCSYLYDYKAVTNFLKANELLSVIRAHEAQDEGYKMHLKNKANNFPTVITLFSAPNYLDAYGNKGAVLRYEKGLMNIKQFKHSPHPYWLPNFMNVFTWSLPFVSEKVMESFLVILKRADTEVDKATQERMDEERKEVIRKKILAASKMLTMMKRLRDEHESIVKLKSFAPGHQIPKGLLTQGSAALQTAALGDFVEAKKIDKVNEAWPSAALIEEGKPPLPEDLKAVTAGVSFSAEK